MATGSITPAFISGGSGTHLKTNKFWIPNTSCSFVKTPTPTVQKNFNPHIPPHNFTVHAAYNDRRTGGGGDFVAGFLVGGAIFGTLAYVFAPQIRRSLLNEDEYGFRKAKRPIYYDEGLETTRQTLNKKISQLNSAIDSVSSRLRGGNSVPLVPLETDPEEATM